MRWLLPLLTVLLLTGCGPDFWAFESIQNTNHPRSTLVLVWFADSPVDGAEALEVTIDEVGLVRDDNSVEVISATPQTFDLLSLRNGLRAKIAEAEVPGGAYRAVRVTLRESGPQGPRIRTGGTWDALPFASAGANPIEVPYPFGTAERVEIHIDFNARLSVVDSPNGPVMNPNLGAVDSETSGEIAGMVRDAAGMPVAGAIVVVRQGLQEMRSTTTLLDGTYRLPWLATGTYSVEVSGPAGPLVSVPDVPVTTGGAENVVLTLP